MYINVHVNTHISPFSLPQSQIYLMDQEKRRMELEVSRMLLHKQKCDKLITELQFQLRDERRKRKRDKKATGRRVSFK